jgi:Tfp pilus assembly protein FimT
MLELVVVLLIIGIMSAVAVPTFVDSLMFYRVESAARRVKVDLELARQTARLTSSPQSVTFNQKAYSTSADIVDLDRPALAYNVDLADSPYNLQTVVANFGGASTITFDGYGTPSAPGTVVLSASDYECTVSVAAATGQVTISRNHPGGLTTE